MAMEIHQLLHETGGVHTLRSGTGDGQRARGDFPTAGGQNQLIKGDFLPADMLTGQNGGFIRFDRQNRHFRKEFYFFGEVFQQFCGIFRTVQIFAEAMVGALQQHAAHLCFPVHQEHIPASGFPDGFGCGDAGSTGADDEDVTMFHVLHPPAFSRFPDGSAYPGTGPYRHPPVVSHRLRWWRHGRWHPESVRG